MRVMVGSSVFRGVTLCLLTCLLLMGGKTFGDQPEDPEVVASTPLGLDADFSLASLQSKASYLRGRLLSIRHAEAPLFETHQLLERWFKGEGSDNRSGCILQEDDLNRFRDNQASLRVYFADIGRMATSGVSDYEYNLRSLKRLHADCLSISVVHQELIGIRYVMSFSALVMAAHAFLSELNQMALIMGLVGGGGVLVTTLEHIFFHLAMMTEEKAFDLVLDRVDEESEKYHEKVMASLPLHKKSQCTLLENLGLLHGAQFTNEQPSWSGFVSSEPMFQSISEQSIRSDITHHLDEVDSAVSSGVSVHFRRADGVSGEESVFLTIRQGDRYHVRTSCLSEADGEEQQLPFWLVFSGENERLISFFDRLIRLFQFSSYSLRKVIDQPI